MKKLFAQSKTDIVFDIAVLVYVTLLLGLFLYPLYFVVIASISDSSAVWNGQVTVLPKGLNVDAYAMILKTKDIWVGYRNTFFYTISGVAINLLVTIPAAYALSQRRFKFRGAIMKFYLFTMFFNGGLIPTYLLVKNMHMLNKVWALILPGAVSVTNLIITRTFFQNNIPDELWEAAFLDGSSDFQYLSKIVMPLSKAIIAVIALYYGVGHWNAYFNAMIYITDRGKFPLQLIMREILMKSQALQDTYADPETLARQIQLGEIMKYGVIVVSCLPPLLIYPFIQKYFVKGVLMGSLKG